jgi:hypothetical protein
LVKQTQAGRSAASSQEAQAQEAQQKTLGEQNT